MAAILRIKRSEVSGNPAVLAAGELAYSGLTDNGSNGGDRLYVGLGVETGGNAVNHIVIGGKYFTDMLDHTRGVLTANSALITDVNSKLNNIKIDNIDIDGNTISSTDINGNIVFSPNGTGYVSIAGTNGLVIPSGTTAQQGPAVTGSIRFNTTSSQFEGYSGSNWASLGGVRSVDGLTYITAENTPGLSDDTIRFYTNGSLSAYLNTGLFRVGTAIQVKIDNTTASTTYATGALVVDGGVGIAGAVNLNNVLNIAGNLAVNTNKFAVDATSGNTIVAGTFSSTGDLAVNTNKFTVAASSGNTAIAGTLSVTGTTSLTGNLAVNTDKFTVNATSGNTIVAGTLTVNGNTTIVGDLTVQGTTTTVNSTAVAISDINLTLAKDATTAAQANGAGLTISGANATFTYVSTTDTWNFNKDIVAPNFTGAVTGNASTATKWQTARDLSLTGDATATLVGVDGTANVSAALTFATVNANVGTFGNSVTVPTFTVNDKGLVTAASQTAIPIATAATTAGSATKGLVSFYSTDFDVTSGFVSIKQIDGGTY
jgi:hypothetical protein